MKIKFFVPGEPQPFPKKKSSRSGMIYSHDPDGIKRGWMEAITAYAHKSMKIAGMECTGENTPVSLSCTFFRTKPKSSKKSMTLPYKKPDLDNYAYSVANALSGVCYWDDSRIVDQEIYKRWAYENQEAGVLIEIGVVK